ncbi:endonuclease/exonuclease/phosphatase family protein, partial [Trifolium medium]|nr:endonuclease/exonuclease/phosphatase family protein [Trifolium medium]
MREKEEREGELGHERGKSKHGSSYAHRMDQISISFFVTNFPDELGWGDLWKLFAKFGSVSDVFIPKKVDKWGRRFGFVKFKEVRDVEDLSWKLEDVWSGNFKLRVNRARFRKGDNKEVSSTSKEEPQRTREGSDLRVKEDVSFKSLLVRDNSGGVEVMKPVSGERRKVRFNSMGDLVPLELRVCESSLKALKNSKVGLFKQTMDFQTFHERLVGEGNHDVKATYMGGNMVLLQSPCEGELSEVMRCNKTWWDHCFLKVMPWKPTLLSESREVWIQIYGIPLHAWEEGSFKLIVGRFGVFLD